MSPLPPFYWCFPFEPGLAYCQSTSFETEPLRLHSLGFYRQLLITRQCKNVSVFLKSLSKKWDSWLTLSFSTFIMWGDQLSCSSPFHSQSGNVYQYSAVDSCVLYNVVEKNIDSSSKSNPLRRHRKNYDTLTWRQRRRHWKKYKKSRNFQ